MEFNPPFSTMVTTIFVFLIIAFLLKILGSLKKVNTTKNRAVPQAKGAWPIIGHLHLLGGSRPPQQVLGDMADKGTRLLVNLWKIQHDPNIWSHHCEFKPERFLTSQKNIDLKGNHFEFLPFGSGRRMCPGVSFALQVLPLTLANVIQQFVISKPSNEPIDMSESYGLTTSKATPLEVLVAPRLSKNVYHVGV